MPSARSSFQDHFAPVATAYAEFRPRYPDTLFDWLAARAPAREQAWDCACGSGQATLDLARRFARVIATDASVDQLAGAPAHERVSYHVAPAEASGLADASVDLVAVAQALHWFDLPRFHAEARRVLKPGGLLAAWSYGVLTLDDPHLDALARQFHDLTLGPYWPAQRRLVERGYRDLDFPFDELAAPSFELVAHWSLPRLLGYFRSWSATARYRAAHGADPVAALAQELTARWGDPAAPRRVVWPLALRAGHA
jgi:ubiquinone/menaquinone biosynthesis C-methylase UbiE